MKIHKDSHYKKAVAKRDGLKCKKCGELDIEKLTVDHIRPISLGGSTKVKNLQFLCVSCHVIKDRNVGQLGFGGRKKWAEHARVKQIRNLTKKHNEEKRIQTTDSRRSKKETTGQEVKT